MGNAINNLKRFKAAGQVQVPASGPKMGDEELIAARVATLKAVRGWGQRFAQAYSGIAEILAQPERDRLIRGIVERHLGFSVLAARRIEQFPTEGGTQDERLMNAARILLRHIPGNAMLDAIGRCELDADTLDPILRMPNAEAALRELGVQ